MRLGSSFLVSLIIPALSVSVCFAEDRSSDKKELDGLMVEMIQLLESENYQAFIEKFMPPGIAYGPDWMQRKEETLQRISERAPTMIRLFKGASQHPPQFYAKGQVAVYRLESPFSALKRVAWVKHRGLWFLFDALTELEDISYLGDPD